MIVTAAVVAAGAGLRIADRPCRWVWRAMGWPARWGGPILVGSLSLIVSAGLAVFGGVPIPQFHDEYSYLLAADTFVHGRLANPPHPMAAHLETFHVLQTPTYASKFPPGQGLLLALGRLLLSDGRAGSALGAAIGMAMACAAVAWALCGVLPRRWALGGGLLLSLHPLILYWSRSYWGGQVAMLGGALVLGATLRLRRRPREIDGILWGIGAGILAISRPFEGCVFALLCAVAAAPGVWRRGPRLGLLIGAVLPMAAAVGFLAMHNLRVTHHLTQFPYLLYESQYAASPPFVWQSPIKEPAYHYAVIRDCYAWVAERYWQQRTIPGLAAGIAQKLGDYGREFLDPVALALPLAFSLVGAMWLARRRRGRGLDIAWVILLLFVYVQMSAVWFMAHYAAPAVGLIALLIVAGARRLMTVRVGRYRLGRAALVLTVGVMTARFGDACRGHALVSSGWGAARIERIEQLRQLGGKHLVIVRPGPGYDFHFDWVYNDADIDASPVVWVRDATELGDSGNMEVRRYFADRQAWVLDVGGVDVPTRLIELPALQQ
jgi:hypothetical protein